MKRDDLDSLIRHCDPGSHSDPEQTLLEQSRRQWAQLSRRRIAFRRSLGTAATVTAALGLFLICNLPPTSQRSAKLLEKQNETTTHPDASSDPSDAAGTPALAAEAVATGGGEKNSTAAVAKRTAPDREPETPTSREPTSHSETQRLARQSEQRNPPPAATGSTNRSPHTPPRTRNHSKRRGTLPASDPLKEFQSFVASAGDIDELRWYASCRSLARRGAATQRLAVRLVPQINDDRLRSRAFQLVLSAMPGSQREVLRQWLDHPTLRHQAWDGLVQRSSLRQLAELIPIAQDREEQSQLCRAIASSDDPNAMAILVDLAEDADWRRAVARNAVYLSQSAIQQLMEILRSSNHSQQTAAAFLIAAIPGPQVDWAMAEMIVGGRSRQAAYLVLLSRNTPDAKLFLARAESRVELRPALVSARMHFEKFQFQLQEWIAASKGDRDESYETGQLPTDQTPKRSGIPLGHLAVRVAVRPTNG